MAFKYVTIREYETGNRGVHEKLDLILDFQNQYIDRHEKRHEKLDKVTDDYKKIKNRIIGVSITLSTIVSLVIGFAKVGL